MEDHKEGNDVQNIQKPGDNMEEGSSNHVREVTIEDVIVAHAAYLQCLKKQQERLVQAQQRNEDLQKKLKVIIAQTKRVSKPGSSSRKPMQSFFITTDKEKPPPNLDELRIQEVLQDYPLFYRPRPCKKNGSFNVFFLTSMLDRAFS